MNRLILACLAGAITMTSCGYDTTGEPVQGAEELGTIEVTLPSGRVVECVTLANGYAGGLWCVPAEPS